MQHVCNFVGDTRTYEFLKNEYGESVSQRGDLYLDTVGYDLIKQNLWLKYRDDTLVLKKCETGEKWIDYLEWRGDAALNMVASVLNCGKNEVLRRVHPIADMSVTRITFGESGYSVDVALLGDVDRYYYVFSLRKPFVDPSKLIGHAGVARSKVAEFLRMHERDVYEELVKNGHVIGDGCGQCCFEIPGVDVMPFCEL